MVVTASISSVPSATATSTRTTASPPLAQRTVRPLRPNGLKALDGLRARREEERRKPRTVDAMRHSSSSKRAAHASHRDQPFIETHAPGQSLPSPQKRKVSQTPHAADANSLSRPRFGAFKPLIVGISHVHESLPHMQYAPG